MNFTVFVSIFPFQRYNAHENICIFFRIAILDEPSSGLDPESRRELWNILLDMRKDHTIFITTHYMEEAEALADKIAIISHGQLLCYGPSIQLKRRFETGYILKLLTNEQFKQVDTVDLIQKFVPDMALKSFVKPTLIISLPYKYQTTFPELLGLLEKKQQELGISSVSITNSSLEDVFLKSDAAFAGRTKDGQDEVDATYKCLREEPLRISGFEQFLAIWYKKGIFMQAQWLYWIMLVSTITLNMEHMESIQIIGNISSTFRLPFRLRRLSLVFYRLIINYSIKAIQLQSLSI